VLLEHPASLADKHSRLLSSRGAPLALDSLRSQEDFTLWNNRPDGGSKYGYGCGGPEEGAPRVGCVRDEAKVYYGRDKVSEGVSLLKDARCKTTHFDWKIFERRRRGETPDATHGDTEEGA